MLKRLPQIAIGLLMANALLICVVHYFGFRSLWLDEAFVADNIMNQPLSAIFQELKNNQQFPRLYLSLIWILQVVLGYEIWVLRLLPFLFSLAALLFWALIFKEHFIKKEMSALVPFVGFLLLLSNHHFFNFAPDLKQYTADVFFSAYGLWFGEKFIRRDWSAKNTILWAWPIVFSFTYVLVLGAYALAVIFESGFSKRVVIAMAVVAGFLGLSYAIDLQHTQARLYDYWAGSMKLGSGIVDVLGGFWSRKAKIPFTVLALVGAFVHAKYLVDKKSPSLIPIAGGFVFDFLFILALLKQYPLVANRLTLFFYPMTVMLITAGVAALIHSKNKIIRSGGMVAVLGICAVVFLKSGPEIVRRFYVEDHWENINHAMASLDRTITTRVVYGDGSQFQIKTFPHKPEGFTFERTNTTLGNMKDERYDQFYFLEATPNGDLERFKENLVGYNEKKLQKHLYLFKDTGFKRK